MRIHKIITALAAGALALGAGLAAPAAASASASPQLVGATHSIHIGPRPDVNNFITYTETNEGGTRTPYGCYQNDVYPVAPVPVASAVNNCEYHVYLQYSNGTSFCINADSTRTDIGSAYRNPVTVQIGPGEGAC
jgi:hypothetical protein